MIPINGTNEKKIKHEFEQRVKGGKCFYQPFLGAKECMAFFSPVDESKKPIDKNEDLGIMLYDVFDIRKNIPLDTSKHGIDTTRRSFYHPIMVHGIINVPPYESSEIYKVGDKT